MLITLVDDLHNYLEGTENRIEESIKLAFADGCTGVWESAGTWLRKLCNENESFLEVWGQLAESKKANTRFRVACFLEDIPEEIQKEIGEKLRHDTSRKVKEMSEARIEEMKL